MYTQLVTNTNGRESHHGKLLEANGRIEVRILWFTNGPMPPASDHVGKTPIVRGGWMWALAEGLKEKEKIQIGIATAMPERRSSKFISRNITFYIIPQSKPRSSLLHSNRDIDSALSVVHDFQPDVIHVHGTERYYGLLVKVVPSNIPIVISIQGLVSVIRPHRLAGMRFKEKLLSQRPRDFVRGLGPLFETYDWACASQREISIIRDGQHFIGRTEWDRAWIYALNPSASYYDNARILRQSFYHHKWDIKKIQRGALLYCGGIKPLKGVFTLLEALAILRNRNVDVSLNMVGIAGINGGIGRAVMHRIKRLDIEDCISFSGYMDADQVASALVSTHVFVHPSFMDNSPNSLAEAMAIGTPCVTTNVGGISSMIRDGVTALAVPAGDEALLAERIIQLMNDDSLASNLSLESRRVASRRHDPARIVKEQIEIYNSVIEDSLR